MQYVLADESDADVCSGGGAVASLGMSEIEQLNFDRLDPGVKKELRELCRLDDYHGPLAILFEYALIA